MPKNNKKQGVFIFSTMDRYIGGVLLKTIMVVLLAFIGINSVFALVDELGEYKSGYGLLEVLNFIVLTTPRRIYELAPFVVFMGALSGLSMLASHSELTVFRTSGVSVHRLLLAVMGPVVFLLICSALIGEYLAPWGEEQAELYKARYLEELKERDNTDPGSEGKKSLQSIKLADFHWYKQAGLFMRVQAMDEQGNMFGIKQYQVNEEHVLDWIRVAESAVYIGDKEWRLKNVVETRFKPQGVSVEAHEYFIWQTDADPRQFSASVLVEPRKLSISDLIYQIEYMQKGGLNSKQYQLALWGKLLQPVSIIALTVLAVGFILGPLRSVGMGARLSIGLLVGLLFKYSQDLFGPLSVLYSLPPWFAVLLPIFITAMFGWLGLRKLG
ncbi:MAG: LPS export ABC transporter permease LptG [Pseudomonadales bacterium]|nr:LPS export ABC transporter permease LptG [Pseudomonadales bacterium]